MRNKKTSWKILKYAHLGVGWELFSARRTDECLAKEVSFPKFCDEDSTIWLTALVYRSRLQACFPYYIATNIASEKKKWNCEKGRLIICYIRTNSARTIALTTQHCTSCAGSANLITLPAANTQKRLSARKTTTKSFSCRSSNTNKCQY